MKTGYTPGPWEVRNSVYVQQALPEAWPGGRTLADCAQEYDGTDSIGHDCRLKIGLENAANARLIAAAPELASIAHRGAILASAATESAYDTGKHSQDLQRLAYWAMDARAALEKAGVHHAA